MKRVKKGKNKKSEKSGENAEKAIKSEKSGKKLENTETSEKCREKIVIDLENIPPEIPFTKKEDMWLKFIPRKPKNGYVLIFSKE